MSPNYGDQFVKSIREYLVANGLSSLGQINAKIVADLAQRFHEKFMLAEKTAKKSNAEDEWIKGMQDDPDLVGIDIRKELFKAKVWCRRKEKKITRTFFVETWLVNADRELSPISEDRKREAPVKPVYTVDQPVPGWPLLLRYTVCADEQQARTDELCGKDWGELPREIREKIILATN